MDFFGGSDFQNSITLIKIYFILREDAFLYGCQIKTEKAQIIAFRHWMTFYNEY